MAGSTVSSEEGRKNLSDFQQLVLPLDFFKDIVDDRRLEKKFVQVPLGFDNEQDYIDIFKPLLMEEVKMQIQRSKFTEMSETSEEVSLRLNMEGNSSYKLEMRPVKQSGERYSIGELLLISQESSPMQETPVHMLGWTENFAFGELRAIVMDLKAIREDARTFKILEAIKANKPWYVSKICSMNTCVREYEGLMAVKRMPLRTLIVNNHTVAAPTKVSAEMQAPVPVAGINEDGGVGADAASSQIPNAVKENPEQVLAIPETVETLFASRYNSMQLKAIHDCRKVAGITLVQGPPGTGKTTTILGILSMLLNAKANIAKGVSYTRTGRKRERNETNAMSATESEEELESEESIRERKRQRVELLRLRAPWYRGGFIPWADAVEKQLPTRVIAVPYPKISSKSIVQMSEIREEHRPQKVLVCAPSNAAIDEVLRRSVKEGIVNEEGNFRQPSIVRVGPNFHQYLYQYSLDKMAEMSAGLKGGGEKKEEEKARIMRTKRIVCATLSTSGSKDVAGTGEDFDTVVIDEASQGVEMSTLVPLKLGCRRLILVGDPKQLPATVFSSVALAHNYDQSLFQRLASSDHKVTMLDEQFRMHPAISVFPNQQFYGGLLKDGRDKETFEKKFPAPWSSMPCFGPSVFFHLKGSQQTTGQSFTNLPEAKFVVSLYTALAHAFPPELAWRSRFAVISPYAEQVKLIKTEFMRKFCLGSKDTCPIDVNTVDGFQGREKDIVIVSTVRAVEESNTIGFVRDKRRMNVAFTRARLNLWVVGHAFVLSKAPVWEAFVEAQQEKCGFMRVTEPHQSFFGRYLKSWYDRHPELERPDLSSLLEAAQSSELAEIRDTTDEVSEAECPAIEESRYRDIEMVSDDDFDDFDSGPDADDLPKEGKPEGGLVDETTRDAQAPDDSKDDE